MHLRGVGNIDIHHHIDVLWTDGFGRQHTQCILEVHKFHQVGQLVFSGQR